MVKVKSVNLKNYCGYKDVLFDFCDGEFLKNLIVFYGPNGTGKSTILQAINQGGNSYQYGGRSNDMNFRKMTYHPDYNPTYAGLINLANDMYMKVTFWTDDGDKSVVMENKVIPAPPGTSEEDKEKKQFTFSGVSLDEIKPVKKSSVFWIDADNPINMSKFQINAKYRDQFIEFAERVYGFSCILPKESVKEISEVDGTEVEFLTDFVIEKKMFKTTTKVHYKRMSAGEKKIATFLATLFNPTVCDHYDTILVDNFSMHVYFKRHPLLIDRLLFYFPNKQFIITDHSGDLIRHVGATYGQKYLYDLEKYTG